jgi:hypothetical protein
MSIMKVYGRVFEKKSGASCRIEVLGFTSDGDLLTDNAKIKQAFPPSGVVFAPGFLDRFPEYQIDSMIEFVVNPVPSGHPDKYLMDTTKGCKRSGFPIVNIKGAILIDDQAINQPVLKQYVREEIPHFFIKHGGFLYGPFESQQGDVVPKSVGTANKYPVPAEIVYISSTPYLLTEPANPVACLDCMTISQLTNFLKTTVKNYKIAGDIASFKRALDNITLDGLSAVRLKRIVTSLDYLNFSFEELQSMAALSADFKQLYDRSLANVRDQVEDQYLTPALTKKESVDKEIKNLQQQLDKKKRDEQKLQSAIDNLKTDLSFLNENKDKLIQEIRLKADIQQPGQTPDLALTIAETIDYTLPLDPCKDLREYVTIIRKSLDVTANTTQNDPLFFPFLLQDFRCWLVEDIRMILGFARLTANCKLVIQQVEPDWIKFEKLYQNGLRQIWESAHESPDLIHFLLLEDLNLAGVECYGKPMLDVNQGIRTQLPGVYTGWPPNLWVFASFLPPTQHGFGLPLYRKTFESWGFVPATTSAKWKTDLTATTKLTVASILQNTEMSAPIPNPYLIE